jgi:hypothetical protein
MESSGWFGPGVKLNGNGARIRRIDPLLDERTADVLDELGCGAKAIERQKGDAVV